VKNTSLLNDQVPEWRGKLQGQSWIDARENEVRLIANSQDILFHTSKISTLHSERVSHQQPEASHSEISYQNRNMFTTRKLLRCNQSECTHWLICLLVCMSHTTWVQER